MTTVNSQKYSKALLEVAKERSQLEVILSEVNELTQLFKEENLASFFETEVYSASAKAQVIDMIKENASDLMKNFLNTVRANGRLADLSDILAEIKNTADDMFKIADVEVVSSVKLTETQIEKFVALAKSKFDLNEVTIVNTVDEKIVGGFIVNSRGKIIDASVKSQLAKISKEIL
ncbi:F0F1 ATP synthase subunit delta [Lactococcus ileimucosae]|uniref:F0F1 ATP synthase subunit delta n=1 Tax=Lactococcus ileimucosae TaxID=2941329 RepID=UPI002043958D|nr:F0F1 ATP synthase subunit delta [Lactococcus ileimucosae]